MSNEEYSHDDQYWQRKSFKEQVYLLWQMIFGLPKSLIFNIKYFGVKGLKLPIVLSYKVRLQKLSGKVVIKSPLKTGMIRLGFTAPENYDNGKLSFIWVNDGLVKFNGNASMRNGVSMRIYGKLTLGSHFYISAPAKIICYKNIEFGDDVLIGWDFEVVDGDAHKIYNQDDMEGERLNEDNSVKIGNRVWFGANCKVLKGVTLGNDVVVGANSIIIKSVDCNNCVIGGNPMRILRQNIVWKV